MKKSIKIITATALVVVCGIVLISFRKIFKERKEEFPQGAIYLYELNPSVAVNSNGFPELVRKFAGNNFTALKMEQIPGGLRFNSSDPSEFYEVNESEGHFSFSKNLSKYMGNYKPSLPDPKAAQQIASGFLRENKLMAEVPEEMHLIHSGGLRADDDNGNVIDKMITLTYGRVIDGTPVIGKGSKIVVNIGEKGAVEGVIRNWKAFSNKKMLASTEVKNEAELRREFQGVISSLYGKEAKAEIKRSYMVYFDNGGKYLQPVMAYESMVTLGNSNVPGATRGESKILPYLAIVEMMRNPADKLNLTSIDPVGLRTINGNQSNPDQKAKPLDKED
jgi:hypothetical protein